MISFNCTVGINFNAERNVTRVGGYTVAPQRENEHTFLIDLAQDLGGSSSFSSFRGLSYFGDHNAQINVFKSPVLNGWLPVCDSSRKWKKL